MLFRISGLAALTAATLHGALVRVEVKERAPVPGTVYERMIGRAYFTVDPSLPVNRAVADLDKAPRNAAGQVEFEADFYILAPKDVSKGNGAIFYDVNNRGNKLALGMFNSAPGSNDPSKPAATLAGRSR